MLFRSANGGLFIGNNASSNNTWNQLKTTFGHSSINSGNTNKNNVQTIVANLDGNVLTPVDKTYLYSQQLRMLDMKNNVIPGRDNFSTSLGYVYSTEYVDGTAYMRRGSDNNNAPAAANEAVEVRALSNTVYFNPRAREPKAGGFCEFKTSLVYRVNLGQLMLPRETLS